VGNEVIAGIQNIGKKLDDPLLKPYANLKESEKPSKLLSRAEEALKKNPPNMEEVKKNLAEFGEVISPFIKTYEENKKVIKLIAGTTMGKEKAQGLESFLTRSLADIEGGLGDIKGGLEKIQSKGHKLPSVPSRSR
jgi:hypothetical protein